MSVALLGFLRRHAATVAMPALVAAFLAATVAIHPEFGAFDVQSLALGALPLAMAAAAQTVVVLSGGVDLSVGSLMAVANVLSASLMQHAGFGQSLLLAVLVLAAGVAAGALNGLVLVASRVPDVVVTLATGFIWGGVALLIREQPGGGAPEGFLNLATGTLFTDWLPNALVLLAVVVAATWLPVRRGRLGLTLYAIGSDRVAAFRSGVDVDRTRFLAYVLGGLFSAMGGLALTMTTGIGSALSGTYYTLSSVAAVVIGGVSLLGGRGGMLGPVLAAFVLTLIPTDLIFLDIDPNYGQVIQGTLIVLVLLLAALVGGIAVVRPGTVTLGWVSNTLLFAAPLGLIAGGETLLLLTGGIDLSVAAVATGSAYLLTANAAQSEVGAVALGLAVGLVVGLLNGVGVAVFRVQPLVMTLGTGLMTEGALVVYSQKIIGNLPHVPAFILALGSGKLFGLVPLDLFLWVPVAALLIVGLRRSGLGRLLYAVGDNSHACRLAGVRVWRVLLTAYVACGLLSAVAGLVLVGATNAADLSLANVYLLPSIAAAIIGGTSIFGGRGGYSGTVVGAIILTVLDSLLTLLDAPEPLKQILYGAIILLLAAAYTRLTD